MRVEIAQMILSGAWDGERSAYEPGRRARPRAAGAVNAR